jgi:hypothetical protein
LNIPAKAIKGNITPIKQDESLVTFAYNISPEEETLDLEQDAKTLYNKIRGLLPVPAANIILKGDKITFDSNNAICPSLDAISFCNPNSYLLTNIFSLQPQLPIPKPPSKLPKPPFKIPSAVPAIPRPKPLPATPLLANSAIIITPFYKK